jgi:hypothetical protein
MYYTQDWEDSEASVRLLASLEPELVVPGHGQAMRGIVMRTALKTLARNFASVAVPQNGSYVTHPANIQSGTAYQSPY